MQYKPLNIPTTGHKIDMHLDKTRLKTLARLYKYFLLHGSTITFPVACPSIILAQASSALLRGNFESTTVLIFFSFTKLTTYSKFSAFGIKSRGTSCFLEKVSFFKTEVTTAVGPGVKSITLPFSLKFGSKVDQGMPVALWMTASYFLPDGLFKATPSGVL
uniref:Uncharacterized protein n=1 Tax=Opuntia streptacantha TaxID=393608 RepID=A0A7C8Z3M0_OPUST